MRIVFMGTPDFASKCLEKLIKSDNEIVGVFTQPDKPVGRKQILTPSDVKTTAINAGINVYQPKSLKNDEALNIIKSLNPQLIVVVAYGKILPKTILDYPKYGCINVHASLLPKYRGAAPIQWSILKGDDKTGVTVMQMDEGLDTGDMLLVRETAIDDNETSEELFDRLAVIGADAMMETIDNIDSVKPVPQSKGDSFYATMISKDMCPIDWSLTAKEVHNHIRGLQSWPCATTTINGNNVKIHKTVISDIMSNEKFGTVIDNDKRLVVACGDGKCVEICQLQLDGKKRMDTKSFLLGHNIAKGTILGE